MKLNQRTEYNSLIGFIHYIFSIPTKEQTERLISEHRSAVDDLSRTVKAIEDKQRQ